MCVIETSKTVTIKTNLPINGNSFLAKLEFHFVLLSIFKPC